MDDTKFIIEIIPENTARKTSLENMLPSTSGVQIVPIERSPSPHQRPLREDMKQGTCAPRRPLENQTSDSGVDVDSIYLDSAPSGDNSPAILRLQTVDSDSSTSVSDVTAHFARVCDDSVKEIDPVLDTHDQDSLTAPQGVEILNGVTVSDSWEADTKENDKMGPNDIDDHYTAEGFSDDVTATIADNKSEITDSSTAVGFSIREAVPGRKSVVRIVPCSAGDRCNGLIRIQVEVVELRPDTPPLPPDTCCLQSKTTQCRMKPANQNPCLKFCMKKNRFIPSSSSFEEMDSYSLDLSGQSVSNISSATTDLKLHESTPDSDTEIDRKSGKHEVVEKVNGENDHKLSIDTDEGQTNESPAKGFKSRRMRASKALIESTRYQDDIVMFSQMIMRKQNEERKPLVKEESNETEILGSLPEGSPVIVTDHIEL